MKQLLRLRHNLSFLALLAVVACAQASPSAITRSDAAVPDPAVSTHAGSAPSTPSGTGTADNRLMVVATTTILGDIVQSVIGEDAILEVILPVGADPHDFQLSSQEVSLMSGADVVVANGLLLEEGMIDTLEAVEADGAHVMEIAPLLDPIPFSSRSHEEGGEDHPEEEQSECDPALGHDHEEEADDHSD